MKPHEDKETVIEREIKKEYILSERKHLFLTREILRSIRRDLWKLYYLKSISQKQRQDIEYQIDKIFYNGGSKDEK